MASSRLGFAASEGRASSLNRDFGYSSSATLGGGSILRNGGSDYKVLGGSSRIVGGNTYVVGGGADVVTEYVDDGAAVVEDVSGDSYEYVDSGESFAYESEGEVVGRTSRVSKSVVIDEDLDVGVSVDTIRAPAFDISRELYEIKSEFGRAQGFSSEVNMRVTRLAGRLKDMKAYYTAEVSRVRTLCDGKLRAAKDREDRLRASFTQQLEASEARAEQAIRELEHVQAQLHEAESRIQTLEIEKQNHRSIVSQTEQQYKIQLDQLRNQLARANEDHQRAITEIRTKTETVSHAPLPELPKFSTISRTERKEICLVEEPEPEPIRDETLLIQKEALETQLDKIQEVHLREIEAIETKHQRIVGELFALREENRTLRAQVTTLRADHQRVSFELKTMRTEVVKKPKKVEKRILISQASQTDAVAERKVEQTRIVQQQQPQPQIQYVQVPVAAPIMQRQQVSSTTSVDSGELTRLRGQYNRLKDDYAELTNKYSATLTQVQKLQSSSNTSQSYTSHVVQAAAPSSTTVVKSGVDERVVRELQDKLFAAERARVQVVTEWQQKMTAREQELMGKHHALEMQIMTIKGEKEREIQSRELKLTSSKNEQAAIKSELEGRLDRLTRDKDSQAKDYEGKITRLKDEVARYEKELEGSRNELREARSRLEVIAQERAQLQAKSNSLESRMQLLITERTNAVQQAGEGGSAPVVLPDSSSALLDAEVRVQEQKRLYEREKRDKEELLQEIQDLQRKLRQARTEASEAIDRSSKSEVREKIVERVVEAPKVQQVVQQPRQVIVRRAMTPAPQRDETQVFEFRRRLNIVQRENQELRLRVEAAERKYMHAQELIAEANMKRREVRVVERFREAPAQVVTKIDNTRVLELEKLVQDLRYQLTVRESVPQPAPQVVVRETKTVDLQLKSQLELKTIELERVRQVAGELEVRLKRSQLVIQQLFAIIERSRQNSIKFSQGVMELQMRHFSQEGGAELQLLQSDRTIADIVSVSEESHKLALKEIDSIAAPITVQSTSVVISEPSSFDAALLESEARLKKVQVQDPSYSYSTLSYGTPSYGIQALPAGASYTTGTVDQSYAVGTGGIYGATYGTSYGLPAGGSYSYPTSGTEYQSTGGYQMIGGLPGSSSSSYLVEQSSAQNF